MKKPGWFERWRRRRVLAAHDVGDSGWKAARDASQLVAAVKGQDERRLREMTTLFINDKDFYGAGGIEVDDEMAAIIAATACVAVLDMGYEWLSGWHSIFVFPGEFRTRRRYRDEHGLEGEDMRELAGAALHEGGLVLSWADVAEDLEVGNDGQNVIIHEIAHKLDMLNGDADGYPPLRSSRLRRRWAAVMHRAYDDLNDRLDRNQEPGIDPYAATEPAEFFAVVSEYYFEAPQMLDAAYPDVLECLEQFYRTN